MWYDIVPINQQYRGIDRLLLASDLYVAPFKSKYSVLQNMYYEYLDEMLQHPSKEGLSKIIRICKEFNKYGISCEMIAYDTIPHKAIWGYTLDYLGIDVVYEFSESLICKCTDTRLLRYFNKNGLLNSEADAYNIIRFLNHGNVEWIPCYVYEITGDAGTVLREP